MSSAATPVPASPEPEDQARAGCYALLARLFHAGPDRELLDAITAADAAGEGTALARAWRELATAARAADPEAACLEYDDIFVGTGKSEITPYATHYLAGTGQEKILAGLKQELLALGLSRVPQAHEPEDHMAALFEVMRHLVLRSAEDTFMEKQKQFFGRYLERVFPLFCDAISANGKADFYKRVAVFARAFLEVETESLKVF